MLRLGQWVRHMTIQFDCPHCKKPLKAPDEKAGIKVCCTYCKEPLTIPGPDDVPVLEAIPIGPATPPPPPRRVASVERGHGSMRDDWVYFTCSGCEGKLRAPIADARKKSVCPDCREVGTVPPRMHLRRTDGQPRPGMTYRTCVTCEVQLEFPTAELGGVGPCPACGENMIFAGGGVIEQDDGSRLAGMVYFFHASCNSPVRCRQGEAGTYSACPACGKACRVPRWASIQRRTGLTRMPSVSAPAARNRWPCPDGSLFLSVPHSGTN